MILNLPFKKLWYYEERPVDIMLRIGSLEDLCDELKISFWQIREYMQKNDFDFHVLLLYHGYLTACEKQGLKKKYSKEKAFIWYEYMNVNDRQKFIQEMTVLFGKMVEAYKPVKKKVETKQSGVS